MRYTIMTFTTKVMRTQTSIKIKCCSHCPYKDLFLRLGPYITWFSEPCTVCNNNCNCDCYVVYVRHLPA